MPSLVQRSKPKNPSSDQEPRFVHRRLPGVSQKAEPETSAGSEMNALGMETVLDNPQIWKILLASNIFIFGKIGFFNRVCEHLLKRANKRGSQVIKKVQTEEDITMLKSEESKRPVILIPAAKNREGLNHLITLALGLGRPIWLVALPSQIERHLLLSFDCFFLSSGVKLDPLNDIVPLDQNDRLALDENTTTQAILFLDQQVEKVGKAESLGTAIYLQIP